MPVDLLVVDVLVVYVLELDVLGVRQMIEIDKFNIEKMIYIDKIAHTDKLAYINNVRSFCDGNADNNEEGSQEL